MHLQSTFYFSLKARVVPTRNYFRYCYLSNFFSRSLRGKKPDLKTKVAEKVVWLAIWSWFVILRRHRVQCRAIIEGDRDDLSNVNQGNLARLEKIDTPERFIGRPRYELGDGDHIDINFLIKTRLIPRTNQFLVIFSRKIMQSKGAFASLAS